MIRDNTLTAHRSGFRTMPANCANTSIVYHGGKLLSLFEGGRPWRLDQSVIGRADLLYGICVANNVGEYTRK